MPVQKINLSTIMLWFLIGVIAVVVVMDYASAQRELQMERANCYATAGKEACEANVR